MYCVKTDFLAFIFYTFIYSPAINIDTSVNVAFTADKLKVA